MKEKYAVFGNPVSHSQSPFIHKLFSEQIKIVYSYDRILVSLDENLDTILNNFFNSGGKGANITLPFKKKAFYYANTVTEQSKLSRVVNTLKRLENGHILGTNTDGIGLLNDLKRLFFINPKSRILLIGSGGAACGVLPSLLSFGCSVIITNRHFSRTQTLISKFSYFDKLNAVPIKELINYQFDLIINATSSSINEQALDIPSTIIHKKIFCYDMFYQKNKTPFLTWCIQHGALKAENGLGMLVNQAAYSVLFWHNILPKVEPILKKIKIQLNS